MDVNIQGTQKKVAVMSAVLAGLGLWVSFTFVLGPASKHLSSLKGDLATESQKKSLLENILMLKGNVAKYESQLAADPNGAWLLDFVNDAADKSGLTLASVTPFPPERMGYYFKFPVAIEGRGTYHQLGKFSSQVESGPHFVKFEKVAAETPESDALSADSVRFKLTLSTYIPVPDQK